MANASQGPIVVFDNSVSSINLAFSQVLERLDSAKGLRGAAAIFDRTEVGTPVGQTDAAQLANIPSDQPSSPLFWLAQAQPAMLGGDLSEQTLQSLLLSLWWLLRPPAPPGPGVAPAALTDNTTGTANDTLEALTDGVTYANDVAAIRNNFADLAAKVNALRTALREVGILL